ncbi:MAG: hypothetical protein QNK37_17450 [Acidobacteriota bacterium]|nr:hypothetical protein [Acidobacteriota bacterium]
MSPSSKPFTRHLQDLNSGNLEILELIDFVDGPLKKLLLRELARHNLWPRPAGTWFSTGYKGERLDIDEVLSNFYSYIYIDRISWLMRSWEHHGDIETKVRKFARWFVTEFHAQLDPDSYRVFQNTRETLKQMIKKKELDLITDGHAEEDVAASLQDESVMVFPKADRASAAPEKDLSEHIFSWNDEWLAKLITTGEKTAGWVRPLLAEKIKDLQGATVTAFTLKALVAPLKQRVKEILGRQPIHEQSLDAQEKSDPELTSIDLLLPSADDLADFIQRVLKTIHLQVNKSPLERERMEKLWLYLTSKGVPGEKLSLRRLSKDLNIPRTAVQGVHEDLELLVTSMLEAH